MARSWPRWQARAAANIAPAFKPSAQRFFFTVSLITQNSKKKCVHDLVACARSLARGNHQQLFRWLSRGRLPIVLMTAARSRRAICWRALEPLLITKPKRWGSSRSFVSQSTENLWNVNVSCGFWCFLVRWWWLEIKLKYRRGAIVG